ncbi:TRCF domain-containing protein [Sphingomonas sp. CFBP8993]|uniref:TRCF domain-containing protein n=1 Tax=Sphingomonas sp. CFBP8993 TaxID=3096526 RepID=UPI002A6B83D6|nr:TRCF domain-containing protein [Sphingomonas sp. CFBP8993]MDY0957556.1 TRCF domain-containing protein [Sphingomonas sp. CFBP8993]
MLSEVEIATLSPSEDAPHVKLGIAELAAGAAEVLEHNDIILAVTDETRALATVRMLEAMAGDATILFCPGSDALPGDHAPASPANVGQRVSALHRLRAALRDKKRGRIALVTSGEALARALPSPETFAAEPPCVATGDACDLAELYAMLLDLGYIADERVDEPGEVATRGQVLDVFPADAEQPLRIEVAEGRITAIRSYDPADQRSTGEIERRELGRVSEPSLGSKATSLLDHLPEACVVIEPAADERRRRLLLLSADVAQRGSKRAARDMIGDSAWKNALKDRQTAEIVRADTPPPRFVEQPRALRDFAVAARAAMKGGQSVVLIGSERDLRFLGRRVDNVLRTTARRVSHWREAAAAEPASLLTLIAPAERGFVRDGVMAVSAADLLGSRADREDGAARSVDLSLMQTAEIRVGDTVIHEDHGIATVIGLEPVDAGDGVSGDAIKLEYAKSATRLVPVADADRLWRYGGEDDAVRLDTLDGRTWQDRRRGVDEAIADTARQLTALAAERADHHAPVLDPPVADYERFAAGFAFTETPDQLTAIEAVRADLASGRPMDRLVVGDVGFGKTEIALRAAAVAALAGRQVVLAAPTTVLARQHLESFTARFAESGIAVAGLSRLSTPAEKRKVKAGLADGSIRVVIGTGAVAAKGVAYKDLALVIVDEEQRFGAADKARLQALSNAHVLTMTATPIPRTLQSALVGLRQLSVIATPPARRQPIRTAVSTFSPETLRAALLRERSRGGQSFVVVPRIADMAPLAEQLGRIVPELEVMQAHGKLPAAAIDDVMVRFGRGDGDVLLATNIIEAGLDVPRANTMAIVHADRFGLSQLHQLRGRVGRGHRRGQVLLFAKGEDAIAPRTLKRLRTLEAFDRLGAGFAISARDLDMRGAGDLLGDTQAGHMRLIGVELYQQLLEDALRTARGETVERWTPELNLGIEGCLSSEWLPDEDLRLSLYARLGRLRDDAMLDAFEEEMEDRFGPLPPEAETLLALARLRQRMRALGIARIDAGPAAIAMTPHGRDADLSGIDGLEEKDGRYLLKERHDDPTERLERLMTLLD